MISIHKTVFIFFTTYLAFGEPFHFEETPKTDVAVPFFIQIIDNEDMFKITNENINDKAWIYKDIKIVMKKKLDSDNWVHLLISSNDTQNVTVGFCVNLLHYDWYGGLEKYEQLWPIQKIKLENRPFVTQFYDNQGITEPYWLNSDGFYIHIDSKSPLFVDQNNRNPNTVCFNGKIDNPYPSRDQVVLDLNYVTLNNSKLSHLHAIKHFLKKPTSIPDELMFKFPIWSTWVRYKTNINASVILEFADEINQNRFSSSQIEIDDGWESCYGELKFNEDKFPNAKDLVMQLKFKGFRVTLWAHPFINLDCTDIFNEAKNSNYLVKSISGSVKTTWWNSEYNEAAIIDFTNIKAKEWWVNRLTALKNEIGFDGFKFDAGETSYLPQLPNLNADKHFQPNIFTQKYIETCAEFGKMIEVRVGHRNQKLPIFIRMNDKDSRWGLNNGLRSVITTLFQMNMNGYAFVLPDMIGGNEHYDEKIDKELFIRWLQANTFLPSIQFSKTPWDFDQETIELSKKFIKLHENYSDTIINLAKRTTEDGSPINAPIWWIEPKNQEALKINDEFLLGENILVAPVLDRNTTVRDIYLPNGIWCDGNNGNIFHGRQWIKNYPAPIDTLPYFIKSMNE